MKILGCLQGRKRKAMLKFSGKEARRLLIGSFQSMPQMTKYLNKRLLEDINQNFVFINYDLKKYNDLAVLTNIDLSVQLIMDIVLNNLH